MIKFVRSAKFFKNAKLRDFLNKYYREDASVGNGSSAAALVFEATTGIMLSPSPTGHLQKVKDARTFFLKLMKNSSSALSEMEKQFVVKEIIEAERAIRIAEKSKYFIQ